MAAVPKKANKYYIATEFSVTLWVVWKNEEIDTGCPSSRAEDGDPLWVSAKVADVLVEPTQGLNLVQQTVVSLSGLITGTEKTCVFEVRKMDVGKKVMEDI